MQLVAITDKKFNLSNNNFYTRIFHSFLIIC